MFKFHQDDIVLVERELPCVQNERTTTKWDNSPKNHFPIIKLLCSLYFRKWEVKEIIIRKGETAHWIWDTALGRFLISDAKTSIYIWHWLLKRNFFISLLRGILLFRLTLSKLKMQLTIISQQIRPWIKKPCALFKQTCCRKFHPP